MTTLAGGALKKAYFEALDLIKFTEELRSTSTEKYGKKINELHTFFDKLPLWCSRHKDGHYLFKSRVTLKQICFQAHNKNRKDNTVSAKQVLSILEIVQDHLNILGDEIFAYKESNWKKEPDYKAAEARYRELMKLPESKEEGKSVAKEA